MNCILTCTKTGRHWRCRDQDHGDRMARDLGLKDYEVESFATVNSHY